MYWDGPKASWLRNDVVMLRHSVMPYNSRGHLKGVSPPIWPDFTSKKIVWWLSAYLRSSLANVLSGKGLADFNKIWLLKCQWLTDFVTLFCDNSLQCNQKVQTIHIVTKNNHPDINNVFTIFGFWRKCTWLDLSPFLIIINNQRFTWNVSVQSNVGTCRTPLLKMIERCSFLLTLTL